MTCVQTSKHYTMPWLFVTSWETSCASSCHSSRWVASSSSICSATRCYRAEFVALVVGRETNREAMKTWLSCCGLVVIRRYPKVYISIYGYLSIYIYIISIRIYIYYIGCFDECQHQWYAVWSNLTSYHVLMGFRRLQVTRQVARNQKTKAPVLCDSMNSPWTWPYYLGWPSILRLVWSETQKP